MSSPEQDFSEVVGRTEEVIEDINVDRVRAMAHTIDVDFGAYAGAELPAGWHWLFFNPFVPRSELGVDGHPKRGGFLPDVGLPRRMWAGGRLRYLKPVILGAPAKRVSTIEKVTAKSGRVGRLVFVVVKHVISQNGVDCIEEEQDIVYREAATPGAPPPPTKPAPDGAEWTQDVLPDPVLLYRYSSLTSNGHRIHYDLEYARNEEHYKNLVVHGPLVASLLQGLAARARPDARLESFSFRATSPIFVDRGFTLQAAKSTETNGVSLWVRGPDGELCMQAEAGYTA